MRKPIILHMRKQRSKLASQYIAFIFAIWTVPFLYFLKPKFPTSCHQPRFVSDLFGNRIVCFLVSRLYQNDGRVRFAGSKFYFYLFIFLFYFFLNFSVKMFEFSNVYMVNSTKTG